MTILLSQVILYFPYATMTIDDNIRDEEIQCDINRNAIKTSALLSAKIDK